MQQPFNKTTARQALHRIPFMTLGLAQKSNANPYVATMLFAVDAEWNIYFMTHASSGKVKIVNGNPKAAVCMYEIGNMYVRATGVVKPLKEPKKLQKVLKELTAKATSVESFWPPVLAVKGKDYVVYQIKTSKVQAMSLANLPLRSNQPMYLNIK